MQNLKQILAPFQKLIAPSVILVTLLTPLESSATELFAIGNSGAIKVFDSATGIELRSFPSTFRASGSIAFGNDGLLYGINQNEGFSVYNPDSGDEVRRFSGIGIYAIGSIAFGQDGDLYAYTNQGYFAGFNPKTGLRTNDLQGLSLIGGPMTIGTQGVLFGLSPSAGSWNAYGIQSKQLVASSVDGTITGHMTLSSNGLLYAQNNRNGFSAWNVATGKLVASHDELSLVGAMSIGPDTSLFGLNSAGGYSVYDPVTGVQLRYAAAGQLNATGDLAFRISAVPEASIPWLLILGLIALTAIRCIRRTEHEA